MLTSKKHILSTLTLLVVMTLTGCNMGQAAEATPTAIDLNAVKTSAAATAFVELTQIASAAPPTFTATVPVTDTPAQSITDTVSPDSLTPSSTPLLGASGSASASAGFATNTPIPSLTLAVVGGGAAAGPVCKNSQYGGDVTIPDGTVFKPWQKFTKAWKVRNTGTCTWDQGFSFRAWNSNAPSLGTSPDIQYFTFTNNKNDWVAPGGAIIIYINMYAPGDPGDYVAHWQMFDDNGKPFGGDFTVAITVKK